MKKELHKTILAGLSLIVLMAFPVDSIGQTTHKVSVTNNKFTPKDITIKVGDIVEWTNTQGVHNVNGQKSAYPGNPESFGNSLGSGWTYSYTFTKVGRYDYKCDPHASFGMVGSVNVVDDSGLLSLKVNFESMNPHIGQMFSMYIKDISTGEYVDSMKLGSIPGSDFDLETDLIEPGSSYHIDFYADHNGNSKYDAPPVDHAWRLEALNITEDIELTFTHNTNFTDIFPGSTGIDNGEMEMSFQVYPNPVVEKLNIKLKGLKGDSVIRLMNLAGQEVKIVQVQPSQEIMELDMKNVQAGVYFLVINSGIQNSVTKVVKE